MEPTEGIQRKVAFTTMIFDGFSHYFLLILRSSFQTISDGVFSPHPKDIIGFLCRMFIKSNPTWIIM